MRSRATSNRPFTTVQALEQQADARFRAKEQELEAQLQEAEQRINELQQQRGDNSAQTDGSGALILTPEQRAEIERFQQRRLEIRQELRQVRRNLDQDIERLGTQLKFINIGLVPIVLTVVAVIAALVVRSRRRRHFTTTVSA